MNSWGSFGGSPWSALGMGGMRNQQMGWPFGGGGMQSQLAPQSGWPRSNMQAQPVMAAYGGFGASPFAAGGMGNQMMQMPTSPWATPQMPAFAPRAPVPAPQPVAPMQPQPSGMQPQPMPRRAPMPSVQQAVVDPALERRRFMAASRG